MNQPEQPDLLTQISAMIFPVVIQEFKDANQSRDTTEVFLAQRTVLLAQELIKALKN